MMTLSIDLETYSGQSLTTGGVYRYAESDDFEILLFAYAEDDKPVRVVDVAGGEEIPEEIPVTGDKGITLLDVKEKKASMDEFIAQFDDEDLACFVRGEGIAFMACLTIDSHSEDSTGSGLVSFRGCSWLSKGVSLTSTVGSFVSTISCSRTVLPGSLLFCAVTISLLACLSAAQAAMTSIHL